MKKVIKEILKGKVAVNCQTLEECKNYLKWAKSKGITWREQDTENDDKRQEYDMFQDDTCYSVQKTGEMKYGELRYYRGKHYHIVSFHEIKDLLIIPIEKGDTVKFKDFVKVGKAYYGMHVMRLDLGEGLVTGKVKFDDCDNMIIKVDEGFELGFPEAILEVIKPAEKKDNPLDPVQIEVKKIKAIQKKQLENAIVQLGGKIYYGNDKKVTKAQIGCFDKEYNGISRCRADDTFNEEFGEYLALWRALNKMTCSEINKWGKGIK